MDTSRDTTAVRVRAGAGVDEETLAYARLKIDAVVTRPGLPAVHGEVRIAKSGAHDAAHVWSAVAELRVGNRTVVTHAEDASGHGVVDRLQDRLRSRTDKAAHAWEPARRTTAPPWRAEQPGPSTEDIGEDTSGGTVQD